MIWSPLYLLPFRLLNRMWRMQTELFGAKVRIAAFFFTKQVERWTWRLLSHFFSFHRFKKESNASSRNKRKKTLYCKLVCDCFEHFLKKQIIFHNTKFRKQILKFIWNTWKCWWNKTDDEILPVFAHFPWALKFIFSIFHGKLFPVLFQAAIYAFRFEKFRKDCKIRKIILVEGFCPLKTEIARFPIRFRLKMILD